jgi:hypothetical protein
MTMTGRDLSKPRGYYEFINSPGNFALQIVQGDWPAEVAADLETAQVPGRERQPIAYEVNFALQAVSAPARVDGLVPGGKEGRKVKLIGGGATREMTLGADAGFAFDDVAAGAYSLELADVGVIADDVTVAPGELFRLLFPLRSKVAGQVLGPADGLVALLYAPLAWGWTRQKPLDLDGSFAFEGLPPGVYRLEIGEYVLPDLVLTGENTLQLAAIDLAQGRRSVVRGRVADRSGRPQPDILMVLRREGLVVAQVRTAADGTYRFANLVAGAYALEVVGMGEVASGIMLDGQREQVRDVLWGGAGPRGLIQGRVLAANAAPQAGAVVRLLRAGIEVGRTQTDGAGLFRFPELPAGVYALAVGEAAPLATDIRLEEDATVTRDVILPAPQKLIAHYLLFGRTPTAGRLLSLPVEPPAVTPAEERLALGLALEYLRRTGASAGFSVNEAMQAGQVTIVGDAVSIADELALSAAGCQVRRLAGDGYAIAAAFEQLSPNDSSRFVQPAPASLFGPGLGEG